MACDQWQNIHQHKRSTVIFLGPLHTDITFLNELKEFLEGSGWTTAIKNAGVTRARFS